MGGWGEGVGGMGRGDRERGCMEEGMLGGVDN